MYFEQTCDFLAIFMGSCCYVGKLLRQWSALWLIMDNRVYILPLMVCDRTQRFLGNEVNGRDLGQGDEVLHKVVDYMWVGDYHCFSCQCPVSLVLRGDCKSFHIFVSSGQWKEIQWFKPEGKACQDSFNSIWWLPQTLLPLCLSFSPVALLAFCQMLLQTGLINKLIW